FETDSNLFEITELSNPYMETANQEEGKCGQGKCGQGTCGTQTPPPQ
ncbi:MAG: hypothetical protein GQ569_07315, partial [Methylococcaceae bacterium]|nr:hypothetical protein [Methylococcaceae bacterium]